MDEQINSKTTRPRRATARKPLPAPSVDSDTSDEDFQSKRRSRVVKRDRIRNRQKQLDKKKQGATTKASVRNTPARFKNAQKSEVVAAQSISGGTPYTYRGVNPIRQTQTLVRPTRSCRLLQAKTEVKSGLKSIDQRHSNELLLSITKSESDCVLQLQSPATSAYASPATSTYASPRVDCGDSSPTSYTGSDDEVSPREQKGKNNKNCQIQQQEEKQVKKTPLRKPLNESLATCTPQLLKQLDQICMTPTNCNTGKDLLQSSVKRTRITYSCQSMQLTAAPTELPFREEETQKVLYHLQSAIATGGCGGCLYISGMPGTGKTATVWSAIGKLKTLRSLPPFEIVEVNAMRVPSPNGVYQIIYKALFKKKSPNAQKAYQSLNKLFNTNDPKRPICVLIVDEVDRLVTTKQTVLYTLFDWPSLKYSKLVVIVIANTMDLPERMNARCISRLGFGRLDFFPYNREQIVQILTKRLSNKSTIVDLHQNETTASASKRRKTANGNSIGSHSGSSEDDGFTEIQFDARAIEMCARKVANLSGDIRRAFQICRRSLEVAYRRSKSKVDLEDVTTAVKDLSQSPYTPVMKQLPYIQKLFLAAVVLEQQFSTDQQNYTPFYKLLLRLRTLVSQCGLYRASMNVKSEIMKRMAITLRDANLIQIECYIPTKRVVSVKQTKMIGSISAANNENSDKTNSTSLQVTGGAFRSEISELVDEPGGALAVALIPEIEEVKLVLMDDPFLLRRFQ